MRICEDELIFECNNFLEACRWNSRKTKKIIITTENGMRRITTDELRYVEVNGHYLYYHTGNEVLKKKMEKYLML